MVLALATVLVALAQHFGLPSILGYLATGVLVGPSALGWISDEPATRLLAELGVVLLMFTIGLEFSLPQLLAAKRLVIGLGGTQVASNMLLFGLAGWALGGLTPMEALVAGGALAMSSTAIVLKQLGEQMELPAPHGRAVTGILLFQDLAAVALLAALPFLAGGLEGLGGILALTLGKTLLVFLGVTAVGRYLLPPVLHWIAATRSVELFMLAALLLALAAGAASTLAGLSPTLGAFMAGMLLGETLFRHQIEADIRPFRDLMLGLFFATVGMRLAPAIFLDQPGTVALILLALVGGKALILVPLARAFNQPLLVARRIALSLAQGGEFGLLLVSTALALGVLDGARAQPLLAALVLSMALAPLLLRFNGRLAAAPRWVAATDHTVEARIAEASGDFDGHVIVSGYGRLGQNLVRILSDEGIPALALDLDPERVRQATAAGEPVLFGNALQPGILRAAGIDRARALAVTIDDASVAERIVSHLRSLGNPLPVLVRSVWGRDEATLAATGATVFPEGLETSLAFAGQLLVLLGVPSSRIEARLNGIRAADYAPLRVFFHDSGETEEGSEARDYPDQVRTVVVAEGHCAVGRTPQEIGLGEQEAELVDVRRGAIRVPGRLLDTRLRAGDVVLLKGRREALDRATACLVEGR